MGVICDHAVITNFFYWGSAAFDTVDHGILLHRLQSKLGLWEKALLWFKSYLTGRTQQVSVNGTLSDKFNLTCGVPQGSCVGPL